MQLLIVDDDEDDRTLFIEAVKEVDPDIECKTANNGQLALDMLRDHETTLPDLIFLDIRMPLLSGKKCLSQLKSDEVLKHIPVVIYTTSRDEAESEELKEMGAFHFISKPSNINEIYYLVSVVLEEQMNARNRRN